VSLVARRFLFIFAGGLRGYVFNELDYFASFWLQTVLHRNKHWFLLSTIVALIIFVRPSALFLAPVVLLILLFLFFQNAIRMLG